MVHPELEEAVEARTEIDGENSLIVYNDDVNTFDHVIESLVKICQHEQVQAEQCTWIIHYNGKCSVKQGTMDKLRPMRQALNERGLTAKVH